MPAAWGNVSAAGGCIGVKVLKYPRIQALHGDQHKLIETNYDDWNLVTGRVGKGKSKWARKNARKLDPSFSLERIHFREEPFWAQYVTLPEGSAIILDEFKGHKRAAMHGERITMLERIKRVRARKLHVFVVYDRVSSLDRELLTDRNAYWHHLENRGEVQVRQPDTRLRFKPDSTPIEPTTYPLVGDFPFSTWEPPGVEEEYEEKKFRETDLLGLLDDEEEEPDYRRVNPAFVETAARELGLFKPGR